MYGSYTYKCITAHSSSTSFTVDKAKWKFFVGNQRLKKHPYSVHNVDNHYESTEADVNFEADFSVDGTTAGVRLTNDLTAGTKVIVTKKVGRVWNDANTSLTESNNKIVDFLKATPSIWHTDYAKVSTIAIETTIAKLDNEIVKFDDSNQTFDRG